MERTDLERTGIVTIAPGAIATIADTLARSGYAAAPPPTGEFPTGYDTSNVFFRVDHVPAPAARLSARYTFYDVASDNARNVGGLNAVSRGTRLDNQDHAAAATFSTTGARLVNELRGQATWSRLGRRPTTTVVQPSTSRAWPTSAPRPRRPSAVTSTPTSWPTA